MKWIKKRKKNKPKKKAINKAKDDYIHKCSLFEQFHSLVCWKTPDQVDIELNKIKGAETKLDTVKQNIKIYVKRLGMKQLLIPWSHNNVQHSLQHLTFYFKTIIASFHEQNVEVQSLKIKLPSQKHLHTLSDVAAEVQDLEKRAAKEEKQLQSKAHEIRRDKEVQRKFDRSANIQPFASPEIDETLIGTRLDVLCNYFDNEKEKNTLIWCQGEVVQVSNGENQLKDPDKKSRAKSAYYKKGEAVIIRWDANKDKDREEETSDTVQILQKKKWNGKVDGA